MGGVQATLFPGAVSNQVAASSHCAEVRWEWERWTNLDVSVHGEVLREGKDLQVCGSG